MLCHIFSAAPITWCGQTYAQEMFFYEEVTLTYNTGMFGEGRGFVIEVSMGEKKGEILRNSML